jgi:hypothetical protein
MTGVVVSWKLNDNGNVEHTVGYARMRATTAKTCSSIFRRLNLMDSAISTKAMSLSLTSGSRKRKPGSQRPSNRKLSLAQNFCRQKQTWAMTVPGKRESPLRFRGRQNGFDPSLSSRQGNDKWECRKLIASTCLKSDADVQPVRLKSIAADFGVSLVQIHRICSGKSWKRVRNLPSTFTGTDVYS